MAVVFFVEALVLLVDLGVLEPSCLLGFDAEEEGVFRTLTTRFVEKRDGGVVAPLLDNGVVDFVDLAVLGCINKCIPSSKCE